MAGGSDIRDLKLRLQSRALSLFRVLAPGGTAARGYYKALNPTRADKHIGSFWMRTGDPIGAWRDEATGDQGDIIDLIAYCNGLDRGAALRWAGEWLGGRQEPMANARRAAEESEAAAPSDSEALRKRALAWWLGCEAELAGTPVATYLAGRGVPLGLFERMLRALRYAPEIMHRPTGTLWPAMMAAMTGPDGQLMAVHRTFLSLDGLGKADVSPNKMIWPRFKGAAVRLWRGYSGLPERRAIERGVGDTLALTEGIEDGLSIAMARPDWRVWAAGTLGNLAEVQLPACARAVVLCVDNDVGNPLAVKLAERATAALSCQGVRVRVAHAGAGKDFNERLQGTP